MGKDKLPRHGDFANAVDLLTILLEGRDDFEGEEEEIGRIEGELLETIQRARELMKDDLGGAVHWLGGLSDDEARRVTHFLETQPTEIVTVIREIFRWAAMAVIRLRELRVAIGEDPEYNLPAEVDEALGDIIAALSTSVEGSSVLRWDAVTDRIRDIPGSDVLD